MALLTLLAAASAQEHITPIHVLEGQPGESLGLAAGPVGDVDADGHDDFFVMSAYSTTIRSGRDASILYAYHLPPYQESYSPGAVTGTGDIDHDGHDDFAVSNPGSDQGCTDCGTVTVYSGRDGSVLLSIHGASDDRSFGAALAPAGDVDGDGTPDLTIGAPDRLYAFTSLPGRILIVSGHDGSVLLDFGCAGCPPSTNTIAVDNFGAVLANAGDVDADGVDDVIATYLNAHLSGYKGYVSAAEDGDGAQVFSGRDGRVLYQEADTGARRVSGLGDLDGDGHADFAISNAKDAVRILSGRTGTQLFVLVGPGTGSGFGGGFGVGVAGVGDTDCDGVGDILVSDESLLAARLYSGRNFLELARLPLDGASGLGRPTLGRVGDVDGDGRTDLVVGDASYGPFPAMGRVTVFSLGTGSALPYGSGCPGSGGYTPVLAIHGCHFVQGSVGFEISQGLGGSWAWLLPSLGAARTTIGGCELLVDLGTAGSGLFLSLDGAGPGQGRGTLTGIVPQQVPVGTPLYLQALVLDSAAPAGWVGSNGIVWTLDSLPGTGLPQTWWVDDDASDAGAGTRADPFREIQAALEAADHGDTILVRDGHYTGPANRNLRFGGKRLTLRSTGGPLACVIDAQGTAGTSVFVFDQGETPDSVLSGFTITGGRQHSWGRGGGISITHSEPTVRHCLIRGNAAGFGGGISIVASQPTIEGCEIRSNRVDGAYDSGGAGIACRAAAATIRNCTIRDNRVAQKGIPGGGGIEIRADHGTLIANCIIRGNAIDDIGPPQPLGTPPLIPPKVDVWVVDGSPTIRFCNVGGVPPPGEGNIDEDPGYLPMLLGGISHLAPGSPCIDAGDPGHIAAPGETDIDGERRVSGGRVDMGADELP